MADGKIIELFLEDDDSHGIVRSSIFGWTGQSIKIPRNSFGNLRGMKELENPGIYFLIGKENFFDGDILSRKEIYVGESEDILTRLVQHLKDEQKEFWEYVILFYSDNGDLTKGDIRYLEYTILEEIKNNPTYKLHNKNSGTPPVLKDIYKKVLDNYLGNIKIIMEMLGDNLVAKKIEKKDRKFIIKLKNILAEGIYNDNENSITVLKGSEVVKEEVPSLSAGYKLLRAKLFEEEIIGTDYKFLKDCEFKSPSAASDVILGCSSNGRDVWKLDGKSLKQFQEESDKKLLEKLEAGIKK
ncbi:MAG: GIY-YIG nuclease family protein [Fusobacteriaceae bacterium]